MNEIITVRFKRMITVINSSVCLFLKIILFVILSISVPNNIIGQVRVGNNTIKGKVFETETKNPIPFAIVFLKNTTIGTSADFDGKYEIKNVPSGEYEIVFSQVSFEMESKKISIYDGKTIKMDIGLKSKTYSIPEVEVVAHESSEWKENLKTFIKEFIGETPNSDKCKIINPEVINFKTDPQKDVFEAFTDSTIVIMNNALGYKISLILKKFRIDYKSLITMYQYIPRFEEMKPEDESDMKHWMKRRRLCYRGSLKHFLISILKNNTLQEGFTIKGSTTGWNLKNGIGNSIPSSDVVVNLQTDTNFFEVKFGSPCLQISYLAGSNDYSTNGYMISELEANIESFIISKYGEIIEPVNVIKSGAWTRMRLADVLPLNYEFPGDQ